MKTALRKSLNGHAGSGIRDHGKAGFGAYQITLKRKRTLTSPLLYDSGINAGSNRSERGDVGRHTIVGFGNYHRVYDSGREGNWFVTGFSPRKQNLSSPLYFKIPMDHHHSEYDLPAMQCIWENRIGTCICQSI